MKPGRSPSGCCASLPLRRGLHHSHPPAHRHSGSMCWLVRAGYCRSACGYCNMNMTAIACTSDPNATTQSVANENPGGCQALLLLLLIRGGDRRAWGARALQSDSLLLPRTPCHSTNQWHRSRRVLQRQRIRRCHCQRTGSRNADGGSDGQCERGGDGAEHASIQLSQPTLTRSQPSSAIPPTTPHCRSPIATLQSMPRTTAALPLPGRPTAVRLPLWPPGAASPPPVPIRGPRGLWPQAQPPRWHRPTPVPPPPSRPAPAAAPSAGPAADCGRLVRSRAPQYQKISPELLHNISMMFPEHLHVKIQVDSSRAGMLKNKLRISRSQAPLPPPLSQAVESPPQALSPRSPHTATPMPQQQAPPPPSPPAPAHPMPTPSCQQRWCRHRPCRRRRRQGSSGTQCSAPPLRAPHGGRSLHAARAQCPQTLLLLLLLLLPSPLPP